MSLQVAWSNRQSKDDCIPIPPHGELHPISFLDHNGQVVRGQLKAPALDTVKLVLFTLVDSAKEENAETLSIDTQDSHYSLNEQARLAELIKVACQSLIREADIQASELRRSHEAAALEYRQKLALQIAKANHQRNWQAPIMQLPVEVFSDMLFISLIGIGATRVKRLRELAHVSKHWLGVVAATARLWAVVSDDMSVEDVALTLRRSKGVKLDVSLGAYPPRPEFIATLAPLASRWRSLVIPNSRLDIVVSSLRSEARLLESIHIYEEFMYSSLLNYPTSLKRLDLCDGTHFRHVNISLVVLPWDSSRLTGLVTLRLDSMRGDQVPSVRQITTILRASPTLESLAISHSEFKVEDKATTSHTPDSSLIHLPDLLDLQLSGIQPHVCQDILSRLRIPRCRKLEIDPGNPMEQSESESPIDYDAPNVVEAVSSSLRRDLHLQIYVSPDLVRIASRDMELHSWTYTSSGVSLWMARQGNTTITKAIEKATRLVERACPEVYLGLYLNSDLLKGLEIDFLQGFARLQSIAVGNDVGEEVLRYLGRDLTNTEGEAEWPCPHLKELDLGRLQAYGIADIRKWVSGRWTKYKETGGPTPEGTVDVITPHGKSGATEKWRLAQKAKKRR